MNRLFLLLLLALCLCLGCSVDKPLTAEELAGKAAKEYYDSLVAGNYEAFLNGRAGADLLPADYRQQLLQVYEHYIRKQEKSHGGIAYVSLSNVKSDTLQSVMQAFLLLTFCDSVSEEIVVPMVECDGRWYMSSQK